MNYSKSIGTVLFLVCYLATICLGQKPAESTASDRPTQSVDEGILIGAVGGMFVRLGMTKTFVLDKLREHYDLVPADNGESIFVVEKAGVASKPIGSLCFTNDRVVCVNKFWGSFAPGDAASLATALYSLLNNLKNEGRSIARIETKETRDAQFTSTETRMIFGSKMVAISVFESKTKTVTTTTSLIEVLGVRQ